ncbi:hypothetical protein GCM10029978_094020 [Actinoallomurus acanthiterrae]
MARFDRYVEELLDFLLTRLDEPGFDRLLVHEPRRMSAAYVETGGGRCETRGVFFTGCGTCSRIPPGTVFTGYPGIDVEDWPCTPVRSLMLRFADDPGYDEAWRPAYARLVSGRFVHEDEVGR